MRAIFELFFTFFLLVTACSNPTNATRFNRISKNINQAVINKNKINNQNKTFSIKYKAFQNKGVKRLILPVISFNRFIKEW